MPKIIRSAGVNIERAHPIVLPMKVRGPAEEPVASCPIPAAPAPSLPDVAALQQSAEAVVEEILARARNDADAMLVNARAETMRVLQEAVMEGHEQGLMEVRRQWAAFREAMEEELGRAAESILSERRQIIRELERGVLDLSIDIAEKVLAVELDRDEQWVAAAVKEALKQMEGDSTAVMRVSAEARSRVAAVAERLLAAAGKPLSCLNVAADAALPPGGCVIETERGFVNNGVEEKFDKLKSVLLDNA